MPVQYPLVNGCRHDFSSVEIQLKNKVYLGVKEISYSDTLEPGEVFGAHSQILGRTRGQLKSEASLTLFFGEWQDFKDVLGNGFMEQVFDVVVNYREAGQAMKTDKIIGARITKAEYSGSQGSDPLETKLSLHVMRIEHGGKDPLIKMLK